MVERCPDKTEVDGPIPSTLTSALIFKVHIMIEKQDWWKPAIFFYVKVTSWIIIPVLLSLFLSRILNISNNQLLFFLLIFISFCFTCFGIYREIKIYKNGIDNKDLTNKKDGNQ